MAKGWRILLGIIAAVVLVWSLVSWQESRADAKLAVLRAEFEKTKEETEKIVASLREENRGLVDANLSLRDEISGLRKADSERSQLIQTIRQLAARQVAEIPSLPPTDVAVRTTAVLEILPTEISVLPSGLLFSDGASKANLRALVEGKEEKGVSAELQKRIEGRDQEIVRLEKIISNQETVIANKGVEIAQNAKLFDAERLTLQQEVKAEKAKARKKGFFGVVTGFIVGIVTKALFL